MVEEKQEINAEHGAADIAPKAEKLRRQLILAASVAFLDIDENEKQALEKVKQEAGEKRGKIRKKVQEVITSSDMRVVRRFWNVKSDDMFMHFIGDQTKVGNFGSITD